MKKIILITILFSSVLFGQTYTSDYTGEQIDTKLANVNWVTPEDYGAIGDGVANDAPAFLSMLASSDTLYIKNNYAKTYNLTDSMTQALSAKVIYWDLNFSTMELNKFFITITSDDSPGGGGGTGFQTNYPEATYDVKSNSTTVFNSKFLEGYQYVKIDSLSHWDWIDRGDLLVLEETEGGQGATLVIDYVTETRLYFQNEIPVEMDTSIFDLRVVPSGDKIAYIGNGFISNGGIRVGGFEDVLIENVHAYMDSSTYIALNISKNTNYHAVQGITALWNKKTTIRDCSADGYMIVGLGYGVEVGMSDEILVDNCRLIDNRHGLTVTNSGGSTQINFLDINNCYASGSDRLESVITSNREAYDTHEGCWKLRIANSKAENLNGFVNLRSRDVLIDNCYGKDLVEVVDVGAQPYPHDITIRGSEFYEISEVISMSAATTGKAKILDSYIELTADAGNAIYFTVDGTILDSLIIKNSSILSLGDTQNQQLVCAVNDPTNSLISYFLADNNRFYGLNIFRISEASSGQQIANEMIFANNVMKFGMVMNNSAASSSTNTDDWVIKNNILDSLDAFTQNAGQLVKLAISNNTFIGCNGFIGGSTAIVNDLIYSGNTYNRSNGYAVFGVDSVTTCLISNNTVNSRYNYTVTEFNGGDIKYIGNTMSDRTSSPLVVWNAVDIHTGTADMFIADNYYYISEVENGPGSGINIDSLETFTMVNNTFHIAASDRQFNGFIDVANGGVLNIASTTFVCVGDAIADSHKLIKAGSGATVNAHNLFYSGTSSALDTTGIGSGWSTWMIEIE